MPWPLESISEIVPMEADMKIIDAAEESFNKANNYWLLTWVVSSIVLLTALIEFRSYQTEKQINDGLISRYSSLESVSREVARDLRTNIYLAPKYSGEGEGIEKLRGLRSDLLVEVTWFDGALGINAPDLTIKNRIKVRKSLDYMLAMLLLNDAPDEISQRVEGEPALLLAEHQAGTFLVPGKVEDLRIEDAARYLWLSTLTLQSWRSTFAKHRYWLENGAPRSDLFADLEKAIERPSQAGAKEFRKKAHDIWFEWIQFTNESSSSGSDKEKEKRIRSSLTLAQTSLYLDQAIQKKSELELRAGGRSSTVEIPGIGIPLQLKDAVLVTPWLLTFFYLSISIYTRRALKILPKTTSKTEVVGSIPSFYAFYGFNRTVGVVVAYLLILLPPLIISSGLPIMVPNLAVGLNAQAVFFFLGCALSVFFAVLTLSQLRAVMVLVNPRALTGA